MLKMAQPHISSKTNKRLKKTCHSSPPKGDRCRPNRVSKEVPTAATRTNRSSGAQNPNRTTKK